MLYIDEALYKIVATLPEKRKKASLNQRMLPLARATIDTQSSEKLLVFQPQVFIQFLV